MQPTVGEGAGGERGKLLTGSRMALARLMVVVMRPWRMSSVVRERRRALRWSAGSDRRSLLSPCLAIMERPEREEVAEREAAEGSIEGRVKASATAAKARITAANFIVGGRLSWMMKLRNHIQLSFKTS